jgi:hypothetical protein
MGVWVPLQVLVTKHQKVVDLVALDLIYPQVPVLCRPNLGVLAGVETLAMTATQ